MALTSAEILMQTAADVVGLFGHAPECDCRILSHSGIAVSGAPASDLNMLFLTPGAAIEECEQVLEAVQRKDVEALLVVDEGAQGLCSWAEDRGLICVGQMPMMERKAAKLQPSSGFRVQRVGSNEAGTANRLAAAAFSLDEAACKLAMAPGAFETDEIDLWMADDEGTPLGCGVFIRTGEHVGIYTMATDPDQQKRGVGRAILETAMAYYQNGGVKRFTLGATEKGYPLYSKVGFEVITRPHVYVIGASTQFPGS
jgi:GNAT superfamily N-acetyltransferase